MTERSYFEPGLESLRGIAALGVAFTHSHMVFNLTSSNYAKLGDIRDWLFWSLPSGGSVIVFFALSGYVLSLAIERERNWLAFVVRRMFRILPALWVAVAAMFFAELLLIPHLRADDFHPWFTSSFFNAPTWGDFWLNLFLFKTNIDQVAWSLAPEMVWSLVLPIAAWLHYRGNIVLQLAALAVLTWMGYRSAHPYIQFAVAFYAGFFVPREILVPFLHRRPVVAVLAVIAGWALLCYGSFILVAYTPPMRVFCAMAAVIVISGVVAAGRFMAPLRAALPRFLGRVSYSFYLLHPPTLFCLSAVAALWPVAKPHDMLGAFVLSATSIILALGVSAACYYWVEIPAIGIGKRAVDWLKPIDQTRLPTISSTPPPDTVTP